MRKLQSIARKLRLIAASDLVTRDKFRYALDLTPQYRLRASRSGGSLPLALRPGTTDSKVFDEIFIEQAYGPLIAALPAELGRITLIDLGANIGLSVIFLVRALEVAEIVAVEPDPGNFQMLSENLRRGGLANRSTAVRAFAGAEHGLAELCDSGNGAWGMRMGPFSDAGIPVLPLASIARLAKTRAPVVLKCDIEGGERDLFLHIRHWDRLIRYIFLELHTEFLPVQELHTCLESSAFRWIVHGTPLPAASIALLLLERGERRNPHLI